MPTMSRATLPVQSFKTQPAEDKPRRGIVRYGALLLDNEIVGTYAGNEPFRNRAGKLCQYIKAVVNGERWIGLHFVNLNQATLRLAKSAQIELNFTPQSTENSRL